MKRNSNAMVIMAIALLSSSMSFAQGDGQRDEAKLQAEILNGRKEQPNRSQVQRAPQNNTQARQEQARPEHPHYPGYSNDHRRDDSRYDSNNYYRYDERRVGPSYQLRRGGYLPPQYRQRQYVVNDWHGHRLNRPPAGYHWVQVGGDYVLVAITTGIILQLLLNN